MSLGANSLAVCRAITGGVAWEVSAKCRFRGTLFGVSSYGFFLLICPSCGLLVPFFLASLCSSCLSSGESTYGRTYRSRIAHGGMAGADQGSKQAADKLTRQSRLHP